MFEPCRVASEEDEVNGTKNYEKVIERVGRIWQKYPSISKYYVIDYIADNPKNMADIQWRIAMPENVVKQSGIYFLRTNFTDCCIWRLPPAVLCCHSDCQSGSDWLAGVVALSGRGLPSVSDGSSSVCDSSSISDWRESLLPGLCWTGGGVPPIQLSRIII